MFGIAKAGQRECLSDEIHAGLLAARILHLQYDAPALYHGPERDAADFLLVEHEFRHWLLHGFLDRRSGGLRVRRRTEEAD